MIIFFYFCVFGEYRNTQRTEQTDRLYNISTSGRTEFLGPTLGLTTCIRGKDAVREEYGTVPIFFSSTFFTRRKWIFIYIYIYIRFLRVGNDVYIYIYLFFSLNLPGFILYLAYIFRKSNGSPGKSLSFFFFFTNVCIPKQFTVFVSVSQMMKLQFDSIRSVVGIGHRITTTALKKNKIDRKNTFDALNENSRYIK